MLNTDLLASKLNENPNFAASAKYFDGAIQLELGSDRIWMKVFMGRVILATRQPPPFGYTFCIKGTVDDWKFATVGPKNRLQEAVVTGRLKVEGNTIEYSRIIKAVYGLSEVLCGIVQSDPASLESNA